ncbi:hypothetical protein ILYODFUR_014156 [Ilyodon furcidens]|uniref:Uncharacterized protein n=1 Tax=Ilyodon furcidens TaxID=33524 RepID=A0ABV0UVB2_9TELE
MSRKTGDDPTTAALYDHPVRPVHPVSCSGGGHMQWTPTEGLKVRQSQISIKPKRERCRRASDLDKNLLKEDESRLDHSVSPCSQMSRFLDIKEFGEAARYLRLSNLEQLAARAHAFDGKPVYKNQPEHYDHSPNMACNTRSAMARLIRDRSLNLFVQNFPQMLDLIWII